MDRLEKILIRINFLTILRQRITSVVSVKKFYHFENYFFNS